MGAAANQDEVHMTTPELITVHGYKSETHHIWTEDGYCLDVHRVLPKSHQNSDCNYGSHGVKAKEPIPVLIHHGLLSSSADWVLLGPEKALAYLLCDNNYDVWLVNARGNAYSRKHKKYTTKDKEFWDFSWHEIGYYDLPATIDYILERTGYAELYYVGYSQGTTAFYVMASEKSEYNRKIKGMISLAPIAFLANHRSPLLKCVVHFYGLMEWGSSYCNLHQWFPRNRLQAQALGTIIRNAPVGLTNGFCVCWFSLIAGFGSDQLDKSMLPLILGHFPAGASAKQIIHYSQNILSGSFRKFDYGATENLKTYGSTQPPIYDLEKLEAMEDYLPNEYDVVVVGTGMTESIVAAAASRIGKKVLHLDSDEYYGGLWATFNFDGLQKWIEDLKVPKNTTKDLSEADLEPEEKFLKTSNEYSTVENIEETWYISNEADLPVVSSKDTQTDSTGDGTGSDDEKADDDKVEKKENVKQWSIDRIRKEYRKFNIDLAPKLLFARGELVELLISSNIARYAEFRAVSRVATFMDGKLTQVPCSRADVFANKTVSVVEKRMLMQLLTSCMEQGADSPEFDGFRDKTFLEYLNTKNLTPIVQHYVVQAIAMATEKTSCRDGVNRTKHFLNSLGRYGNTPFLWPMYGSGELPQCFCRLCAVFGGVYCLKRQLDGVVINKNKCKAIISGKQRISLEHLVLGQGHLPPEVVAFEGEQRISRGIFITDRSIMQGEKENLTLLYYPPEQPDQEPVTLIELGPSTNACPQGLFMVHMTCKRTTNAKEDLAYVVNKFLRAEPLDPLAIRSSIHSHTQTVSPDKRHIQEGDQDNREESIESPKPQVLWSLYLNLPASDIKLEESTPSNLHLCSGPDLELDFDFAVNQAKSIFESMYPDKDFLPRAPDPEEIVLEGEEAPGPKFEGDTEAEEKQDVEKAEKED